MKNTTYKIVKIIFFIFLLFLCTTFLSLNELFAGTTEGTIDGYRYKTTMTFHCGNPTSPDCCLCDGYLYLVDINTFRTTGAGSEMIFKRTSATPKIFTIVGEWVSDSYYCEYSYHTETVKIALSGDSYIATKITGDACVPAGHTSFFGTIELSAIPTELTLARISDNTYSREGVLPWWKDDLQGFTRVLLDGIVMSDSFYSQVYQSGKEVVVAFRGTYPYSWDIIDHILADTSFVGGLSVTNSLKYQISEAVKVMQIVKADPRFADCNITLAGHSLGGAIAQIIGYKTGLPVLAINAPMSKKVYNNTEIQTTLSNLNSISWNNSGSIKYLRMYGDIVSSIGESLSGAIIETIDPDANLMENANLYSMKLTFHSIKLMINAISSNNTRHAGLINPSVPEVVRAADIVTSGPMIINSYPGTVINSSIKILSYILKIKTENSKNKIVAFNEYKNGISPELSTYEYYFEIDSRTPSLDSVLLPSSSETEKYTIQALRNGTVIGEYNINPLQWQALPSGTNGIMFTSLDKNTKPTPLDDCAAFSIKFSTTGEVNAKVYFKDAVDSTPPIQLLLLN